MVIVDGDEPVRVSFRHVAVREDESILLASNDQLMGVEYDAPLFYAIVMRIEDE